MIFAEIGETGELFNTCLNLVKYLKIQHNVIFLGIITPDDFKKYLSESLAFVQHSVRAEDGDMEGTPVAILEASAAGLPVISTYHAGIPDVIIHNETGLLSNEHDVKQMTQHMLQLLDSPENGHKMGLAGKAHIAKYFNIENHLLTLQKTLEGTHSELL